MVASLIYIQKAKVRFLFGVQMITIKEIDKLIDLNLDPIKLDLEKIKISIKDIKSNLNSIDGTLDRMIK